MSSISGLPDSRQRRVWSLSIMSGLKSAIFFAYIVGCGYGYQNRMLRERWIWDNVKMMFMVSRSTKARMTSDASSHTLGVATRAVNNSRPLVTKRDNYHQLHE